MKYTKRNSLPFWGFFLLTLGNGKYVTEQYGFSVEYIGLLILVFCIFRSFNVRKIYLNKMMKCIFLTVLLCIGSFFQTTSTNTRITIVLTSILIILFSTSSEKIFVSRKNVEVVRNALFSGYVVTCLIGLITGTLGCGWNPNESIVGILFLGGFAVKNYSGGILLAIFICEFINLIRRNELSRRKGLFKITFIFILTIFSGSKGAIVLCIIFAVCCKYEQIIRIGESHKVLTKCISFLCIIFGAVILIKYMLPNIGTYAYRLRGVNALFEDFIANPKHFIFGMSEIAFADTGYDYANNMRNYLGWQASVEMAYVNIFIKSGLIGVIGYILIFWGIFKAIISTKGQNYILLRAVVIIMILSGFVETYIVSVHYVVGPTLYCLLNSIMNEKC